MRFDERNGNGVLERGFRLLDAFREESSALGLSELARRTKLPKATVFRLASQLVEVGALHRSGQSYQLGLRLFELGAAVAYQRRLRDTALPFMEDLYEATHQIIHLGVPDHLEVLYIERIAGHEPSPVATRVGTRKPLHCTGLGKAILSRAERGLLESVVSHGLARHTPYTITSPTLLAEELDRAAREGVAYDREEFKVGTVCVASPILDSSGHVVGAISVTGRAGRFSPECVASAVRTATLGLIRALHRGPPTN
jgi:DNA-binding IclR family transcriptional regulator